MSRPLSQEAAAVVDTAVAEAIDQSPGRLLAIAEAKVIEADRVARQERLAQARDRRGVWFPRPRPGALLDEGQDAALVGTIFGRLDQADALDLDHALEDLAGGLAQHGDCDGQEPTRDQLRADSLTLLARPEDALTLPRGPDEQPHQPGTAHPRQPRRQPRPHPGGRSARWSARADSP